MSSLKECKLNLKSAPAKILRSYWFNSVVNIGCNWLELRGFVGIRGAEGEGEGGEQMVAAVAFF